MKARSATVAGALSAAAVAGVAAGILLHTLVPGSTPSGAPSTPRVTRTTTTSTTTTTASSPTTSATASTPPSSAPPPRPSRPSGTSIGQSADLSEANLMVANDYLSGGFTRARVTATGPGTGQATISACQTLDPSRSLDLRRMFNGFVDGEGLFANQYVLDFTTTWAAVELVSSVDAWRRECPKSLLSSKASVKVGPVNQVRLADASEGQWWDQSITWALGEVQVERVFTGRTGTRVTVVVVHGPPDAVSGTRPADLLKAAVARLG